MGMDVCLDAIKESGKVVVNFLRVKGQFLKRQNIRHNTFP